MVLRLCLFYTSFGKYVRCSVSWGCVGVLSIMSVGYCICRRPVSFMYLAEFSIFPLINNYTPLLVKTVELKSSDLYIIFVGYYEYME
jgi:hypothetical protein